MAHREKLDLVSLLYPLAEEHRGGNRRRLLRLARRLQTGCGLVPALEQTPDVLRDEDVLTLRFATQTGTLPETIESLANQKAGSSRGTVLRIKQGLFYGICLTVVCTLIILFMMILIAPTYQQVFEEFGLKSSSAFRAICAFSETLAQYFPVAIGLLMVGIVGAWLFKPVRRFRRALSSRVVRPVARLRTAHLLRMLSMASRAGRPLAGSISTLARYHYDNNVRSKLLFARNEVEQGAELWDSLAASRLIGAKECRALGKSPSSESRIWLMDKLATWIEEQVRRRTAFWAALIHPFIVLLFGAIVLWVALAFFSMIVAMIGSLA